MALGPTPAEEQVRLGWHPVLIVQSCRSPQHERRRVGATFHD